MVAFLTVPQFVSRSIMPPDDLLALARLTLARGADSGALDAPGEEPIGVVTTDGAALTAILLTASSLVATNASNYATASVYKRTNGVPTLIAQGNTSGAGPANMGPLPANVAVAVPFVSPPVAVAFGDALSLSVTKAGTGVQLPALKLLAPFSPSFLDLGLERWSSWIRDRLRKRYDTEQIDASPPTTVCRWLEALFTRDCYMRRGWNPSAAQDEKIDERAQAALAEIKEASDSKDGLIELPLLDTADPTAVSRTAPLAYSETSPYVWADQQAQRGSLEDGNGRGTGP